MPTLASDAPCSAEAELSGSGLDTRRPLHVIRPLLSNFERDFFRTVRGPAASQVWHQQLRFRHADRGHASVAGCPGS